MSEWRDALIDYVDNNLPENFEELPKEEQDKIMVKLEKEFTERGEMAEYYMEDR